MARKTIEMRLAEIEAQKKTLKARLSKQERANDTRRKVLLGGLVLHHLKARPDEKFSRRLEDFLRRILPRVLTRDVDKDLFADLLAGLRRRKSAPMLLLERPSERRCGTPMSEIDRDLIPSREEERLLKRTLGCAIPEFIANFGADEAVKRVETELRRARRARSRKLYAFWSAVLAHIDPGRNEGSIRGERTGRSPFGPRRGRQSHEGPARPGDDRISPAPTAGAARPVITGQALETPAPNAPRAAASRA